MCNLLAAPTNAFVQAFSSLQRAQAFPLSSSSAAKVDLVLSHAWVDSTTSRYQASLEAFLLFCNSERVPASLHLPASNDLLCAFAASKIGSVGAGTVQGYLAAIKAWHVLSNKPWLGGACLRYILNGIANLAPVFSSRPPRPPISRASLILLTRGLDLSSNFNACCFAATCTALWAQLHLGKILSPWEKSFLKGNMVCRAHLQPAFNANGSHKCHLPFTKVAKSHGEDVVICRQADASDPINALDIHHLLNNPPADILLFSYRLRLGWRCLTQRKFLACCNLIWLVAGLLAFTGHSFCIGGTTKLLLSGVPPNVVKALGRWSSDTFLCYWRSLDLLAPLHAELLPSRSH